MLLTYLGGRYIFHLYAHSLRLVTKKDRTVIHILFVSREENSPCQQREYLLQTSIGAGDNILRNEKFLCVLTLISTLPNLSSTCTKSQTISAFISTGLPVLLLFKCLSKSFACFLNVSLLSRRIYMSITSVNDIDATAMDMGRTRQFSLRNIFLLIESGK